ncbi:MAG: hypothetical protein RBT49_00135 [Bacteroidales bacterium]|jgi:hypothetical protein|nr:hypothetical protein [Bacteroidales bacterium]
MKKILIIIILLNAFSLFAQQLQNGYELIDQMYNANKASWYKTLCFSQEVIYYKNDSIVGTDVWLEAYQSPSNLILKFTNWASGNGLLFTNDSLYTYQKGTLQSTKYRIHDLVVLGLDINNIPPEITAERTEKCGYNLNLIAEDQCLGQEAWLVGDTSSTCFWVDKKTLLFLKMRRKTGENSREVEFDKYENINGYPVATVIKFYNNHGELNMIEKYFNIYPNCSVPSTIYNPMEFNNAEW